MSVVEGSSAHIEEDVMRPPPGELPTAGQRHGRKATRRPAVDNSRHHVKWRQPTDPEPAT